jgi:hypothetical protein
MTDEQKKELYQSLVTAINDYDLSYDKYLDTLKSICGDGSKFNAYLEEINAGPSTFEARLTIETESGPEIHADVYANYFVSEDDGRIEFDKNLSDADLDGDELPDCTFETLSKYIADKAYKSLFRDKEEIIGDVLDNLDEGIDPNEVEEYLSRIFELVLTKCIAGAGTTANLRKILNQKVSDYDTFRELYDKREDYLKYHNY